MFRDLLNDLVVGEGLPLLENSCLISAHCYYLKSLLITDKLLTLFIALNSHPILITNLNSIFILCSFGLFIYHCVFEFEFLVLNFEFKSRF